MFERFVCPQGHRWQLRIESAHASAQSHSCPACGGEGELLPQAGGDATSEEETETVTWYSEAIGGAVPESTERAAVGERPDLQIASTVLAVGRATEPPVTEPESTTENLIPSPERQSPRVPAVAGYEILGVLGRGGMGVVYKARQTGLNRLVALKMIRAIDPAHPSQLGRFRTEAEAVARLRHPNIVQIYEVGEADGCPFLSLEYVEGGALSRSIDGTPVPARQAAELIEAMARAMEHAHTQHILHRDLKPSNVLLQAPGLRSGSLPVPKVADFGLAKRLDQEKGQTHAGTVVGTPSYMPPEQAEGRLKDLGPAVDIYALGAILYELLTGRPPFKGETLMDTVRQVVHEEPVPPLRLNSKVPHDLQVICLKCLEKDPRRRYLSAAALADDLRRWLGGEPIKARSAGALERAVKWSRRRPASAALIAVSVLALAALLALGVWHDADTQAHNHRLQQEKTRADEQRDRADGLRSEAEQRELTARRYWYVADLNLVQQAWEQNQVGRASALLRGQITEDKQAALCGFEWHYWWRLCHSAVRTLTGHKALVMSVAYSPDGKVLATGSEDGTVRLWDARTGEEREALPQNPSPVTALAFTPDGKALAVAHLHGTIDFWDTSTRQRQAASVSRNKVAVIALAYAPDGQTLAFAAADGKVTLWEPATRKVRANVPGHQGRALALAWSHDGTLLATAGDDKVVKIRDPVTGNEIATLSGHTARVWSVAFAADDKTLASGSDDATIRLWDVGGRKERSVLTGHQGAVWSVAFAHSGQTLVSGSEDTTVRLWDATTGWHLSARKGHSGGVKSVAFSPNDQEAASGSADTSVKVWDAVHDPEHTVLTGHDKSVWSVAFARVGGTLATAGLDETVRLWDPESGKERTVLRPDQGNIAGLAFSPDGRLLATAGNDSTVKLWEVSTGKERATLRRHTGGVLCVVFSPDGQTLASAGTDKTIQLWDVATGEPRQTLTGPRVVVSGLAFAPDGRSLVSAGHDGVVRLWDLTTFQEQRTLSGHSRPVYAVTFSPDGKTLATGGDDALIKLWDVESGRELATLSGHAGMIRSLAFSPDGRELAAAAGTVKLWDTATGQERATLAGPGLWLTSVAWSADGYHLAAGTTAGPILLWDGTPVAEEGRGK
jgi:WD40 repeat protein